MEKISITNSFINVLHVYTSFAFSTWPIFNGNELSLPQFRNSIYQIRSNHTFRPIQIQFLLHLRYVEIYGKSVSLTDCNVSDATQSTSGCLFKEPNESKLNDLRALEI